MRRFVIGVAMATAGALMTTACASSTGGHPVIVGGRTAPNPPTTSSRPTTSTPPTGSTPSTPATSQQTTGGGLTDQQAQGALLTAAEVGGGFKAQPANDKSSPLPCDQQAPSLDQQFQPTGKARTDLVAPDGQAYLSEEVIGYDSAATADKSLAAGEKGLSCRRATIQVSGHPVVYRIDPVQDVTKYVTKTLSVPVDKALDWTVHTSVVNIELVATKIGAQLVVLTFGASPRADTANLPNKDKIVADALKKVRAHI